METANTTSITIEATVNAPVEKVWSYWSEPKHITRWAYAVPEWHAPYAENNLVEGGSFKTRMEARDGSFGFDFGGTYTRVEPFRTIEYTMSDGRKVKIRFEDHGIATHIVQTFDAENTHSPEQQKTGWQAILDNFKKYTEGNQA